MLFPLADALTFLFYIRTVAHLVTWGVLFMQNYDKYMKETIVKRKSEQTIPRFFVYSNRNPYFCTQNGTQMFYLYT